MSEMLTAREAYDLALENVNDQVEAVLRQLKAAIQSAAEIGHISTEIHVDQGLLENLSFERKLRNSLKDKGYNFYYRSSDLRRIVVHWNLATRKDEQPPYVPYCDY